MPATLECAEADGKWRRLAAWTLDLGREGVGVFVEESLTPGEPVRVGVEDGPESRRRIRHWSGRIVNVVKGPEGVRLGVSFDDPEAGPAICYLCRDRAESPRLSIHRVDPPWSEPGPRPAQEPLRSPARGKAGAFGALRMFQILAIAGFVADQTTKAIAFSGSVDLGIPVKNFGSLGGGRMGIPYEPELLTLLTLGLIGFVARRAFEARDQWRPLDALGWGSLFAGLLGNAVDRLHLGYVRDFLRTTLLPSWIFNLADVFVILGALLLILSWMSLRGGSAPVFSSSRPGTARAAENLRIT